VSPQDLIAALHERDVWVWADGDRLRFSAPPGFSDAEILATLRQHKPALLTYLNGPSPLSFAQQRLWILDRLAPGAASYNTACALELRGRLDVAAMATAMEMLLQRHGALRTVFVEIDGEPRQQVQQARPWALSQRDLSQESAPGERLAEMLRIDTAEPFDLAAGPLFRAVLYRVEPECHVLLMVMHHVVSDGWSLGVLQNDLAALYNARLHGRAADLPAIRLQYCDYARWQRRRLQGEALATELAHWRDRLAGAPTVLELPGDRSRPPVESHKGSFEPFVLPLPLVDRLQQLSRREGVTLFMTLFAGFATLLGRYTGTDDLLIGTPVAGRQRAETEPVVGLFANTVVLRADLSGDPSTAALLSRTREACLDAFAHQETPFERLVDELHPTRDLSRNPVFQVMFALENTPAAAPSFDGLAVSTVGFDSGAAQFDLALYARQTVRGVEGSFNYATDLLDRSTITRMAAQWQTLLEGMAAAPTAALSGLALMPAAEEAIVVRGWNDTAATFGSESRLHRLIEAQAARTPEASAVIFEEKTLSFAELDARANQLARVLRARGVGADVLVGVCAERSIELVVALLAVLKAGGAYVPLDPSYPADRLGHMLEDAAAPVVLVQPHLRGRLPATSGDVLPLDADWTVLAGASADALADTGSADDLAYVIFTSGSTGRPKGAMNAHRGIVNRLHWMQATFGLMPSDRVLQKTPYSFDVSVWEFFWPLLAGTPLVVARPEGHKDPRYLRDLIKRERITTVHFVPSMLRAFLDEPGVDACSSLVRVICSGEALPHELQERVFATLPNIELHNLYGPTECAVDVSHWACRRDDPRRLVPIGRPIANTRLYVLDPHMAPVPIGVPGELYIGGVQVGRGYVNRAELTLERFAPDPFAASPEARLYKTGDRARWLADGSIEYLGRLDFQVKIRGQRIELGEIEAVLDQHSAVAQSVVLAREDARSEPALVAYVVAAGPPPDIAALRAHLAAILPAYMVPAAFVVLDALPLTASGKLDRRALPAPEAGTRSSPQAFVEPRTPTEIVLAEIWAEIIGVDRVGLHDNFFELGGHSLLATQVVSRTRERFGVPVPLGAMFEEPTLAGFADYVTSLVWSRPGADAADDAGEREHIRI
jgi:amino acid adenylation domain-containing protein